MSKIVFVPLTDEMVFDRPDLITGPITTYRSASLNKSHPPDSTKSPVQVTRPYLRGDLLNGFDVVYIGDPPTKTISS